MAYTKITKIEKGDWNKVHKYTMEKEDETFELPDGSMFLDAMMQNGKVVIYFLVNPTAVLSKRRFILVGTGKDMPEEELHYCTTLKLVGDGLIGHVWEYARVEQSKAYVVATGRNNSRHDC